MCEMDSCKVTITQPGSDLQLLHSEREAWKHYKDRRNRTFSSCTVRVKRAKNSHREAHLPHILSDSGKERFPLLKALSDPLPAASTMLCGDYISSKAKGSPVHAGIFPDSLSQTCVSPVYQQTLLSIHEPPCRGSSAAPKAGNIGEQAGQAAGSDSCSTIHSPVPSHSGKTCGGLATKVWGRVWMETAAADAPSTTAAAFSTGEKREGCETAPARHA